MNNLIDLLIGKFLEIINEPYSLQQKNVAKTNIALLDIIKDTCKEARID
jgi:hypothetical protein